MKCPNCSATLSDTAKFCDQCGMTVYGDETQSLATALDHAFWDCWGEPLTVNDEPCRLQRLDWGNATVAGKACASRFLRKARELLCGPKDAEIARLTRELDEKHAKLVEVADKLRAERTAAANARRDAFDSAIRTVDRPSTTIHNIRERLIEKRDTSQPAAETQTPKVFVGVDHGSPDGDQAALVEMEQQQDGTMLVTRELHGKEAEAEIARREQPPARDVEGLARALQLCWERDIDWSSYARQVLDYLDGGPRT